VLTESDIELDLPSGRHVGVLTRGPADGTPVLYVHGWPGSRLEQYFIPDDVVERHNVRLISVDRPGYGKSDALHGTRAERMADALGVCDHLGIERLPAVGLSCGAHNVVALAASAPDRITHLVLSSGQMPYDDRSAIGGMVAEDLDGLDDLVAGRTEALEVSEESYRQDLLRDGGASLFDADTMSAAEWTWLQTPWVSEVASTDMREGVRSSYEGLIEDALVCVTPFEFSMELIRCPVYAVHGSADDWEPLPNLLRFLDQWPLTQLIRLEGMSHLGPLLFPDLLLSLAVKPTQLR
jgi:pimeloyl-ACP methyl ester carboxylesterase